MNPYHRKVQAGIDQLGHRRRYRRVYGDSMPLHINHTWSRQQIIYHPDAHFITSHGKVIIFEVLDDQIHDDNLIIADVIQAYVTPNAKEVFFIVPSPSDQDKVRDIAFTILARLVNMGIPEQDLPKVRVLFVSRSEAKSARRVADVLVRGASEL